MKLDRKSFLQKLLCVQPGLGKTIQQSDCIVFKKGRLYTLSQEIACSLSSDLPVTMEAAVPAEKFLKLLERFSEEEIDVSLEESVFHVKAKRKNSKLPTEQDIVLPVDEVDRPGKKLWKKLHEDFSEAVELVSKCCKKEGDFANECIHVHPEFLESSDNVKMIRYPLKTFVKKSVLVRGRSLKAMTQLGMTMGQETDNWLHFWTPMGLRLSVKKFDLEHYPDLSQFLNLRGKKINFPQGLETGIMTAEVFKNEQDNISVKLSENLLTIVGESSHGEYREERDVEYDGKSFSFFCSPKLFAELVSEHTVLEVTECSLRVDAGKFVFVTSVEVRQ
jgi:hypothetical protein